MCLLQLHQQSSFITCIYSHIHHTLLFTFARTLHPIPSTLFQNLFPLKLWKPKQPPPPPPSQTRVYLPPRASPRLARSPQTGSTTLGPSIPVVPTPTPPCTPSSFRPCSPVPSIISAPRPPSRPHKGCEPKEKKRRNKKKARIIQPLPCRTVLAQVPSFVPGPASPRLACPANTPSSRREQQPAGLGDGTGVWCYLKRYSLAPRMAPWSPADSAC